MPLWARVAVCLTCAALFSGCAGPRLAADYPHCVSRIRTVAILPVAIESHTVHAGGILEKRPDLEPALQSETCAAVKEILERRGRVCTLLPAPGQSQSDADALALLRAVCAGIVEHHYVSGHATRIEYGTGRLARTWGDDQTDAVLCLYLQNILPTGGRRILQGTAVVVAVATRIPILMDLKDSVMLLILLDRRTGEVLWFNQERSLLPVSSAADVRNFVTNAVDGLLVQP